MKTITIPKTLNLEDVPDKLATFSFYRFVAACFDTCGNYNGGFAAMRECHRLLDLIEHVEPGAKVELEGADYQAIRSAVDGGRLGLPGVTRQCRTFYAAFEE